MRVTTLPLEKRKKPCAEEVKSENRMYNPQPTNFDVHLEF